MNCCREEEALADAVTDLEVMAAAEQDEGKRKRLRNLVGRIDSAMRSGADFTHDKEWRKHVWEGLEGSGEHKRTHCMEKMKGKVNDPAAFCQSLYSEFAK